MRYGLLLLLLCSRFAFAGDAASCIQLGTTAYAQSIKNTCGEDIIVFWCHDSDKPGTKVAACGTTSLYYRMRWVLKPGQSDNNQYSLPLEAMISYGACFGGYGSYEIMDDKGGYLCKPPKAASGDSATFTTTTAAPSADEACNRAQDMAKAYGTPGECDCKSRGGTNICRVQTSGPKPDVSVIGTLKGKVRELAKCKADDNNCKTPLRKNGGAGVRG